MATARAVLEYLAALAPSRRGEMASDLDALASPRDFVWLGDHPLSDVPGRIPPQPGSFDPKPVHDQLLGVFLGVPTVPATPAPRMRAGDELKRLASVDALTPGRDLLRGGSVWLVGRRRVDRRVEVVSTPLLSRRLRLHDAGVSLQPEWLSDVEVHPLFAEHLSDAERDALCRDVDTGARRLVIEACRRAGFAGTEVLARDVNPLGRTGDVERRFRHAEVATVVGLGTAVYLTPDDAPTSIAASLGRWADEHIDDTAFARVYGLGDARGDGGADARGHEPADADALDTPLPVNARQRAAIRSARVMPVSVVSGPPGTGKTHLVVAAAVDAVASGQSVLIATQSDHASESICELLDRHPTPPYVRFGRAEHRQRVAERLSAGRLAAPTELQVDAAQHAEGTARLRRDQALAIVRDALDREAALAGGLRMRASVGLRTADAPGVLREGFPLVLAEQRLERARAGGGPLARWRARRAERALRLMTDARHGATLDTIGRAVAAARAEAEIDHALATGGTTLDACWVEVVEAEEAWRAALAEWIDVRRRHVGRVRRRRARAGVAALASVLRAGVGRRAELLSALESDDFLDLLPLWVGTLDEIERTLPAMPALFDLVILDEASQIDQLRGAGALCRAERVMVVGDPKQLRHVSFLPDDAMERALDGCGIASDTLRRLLDVRRNSLFDVAAGAAPAVWLDEHFRSVPHLIDFSARHFYDGELRLMTQHPGVEGVDAIDQHRIDGTRVEGVNRREIDAVRDMVAELAYQEGTGTIGVITPFRKQADAIREMLVERFSLSQIRQFGLRSGTVHNFQGSERDTVIISLGLDRDSLARSLRFVQDPGLFNVMITRARRRIVLLHSFDPGDLPPGLLAEYFRFVDDPPGFSPPAPTQHGWRGELAAALWAPDARVVMDYPVAGWTIDIAFGDGGDAVGIECSVHPAGVEAHIERHLTLRRAGWTLTDAFESRWMMRPEHAAAHIAAVRRRRMP